MSLIRQSDVFSAFGFVGEAFSTSQLGGQPLGPSRIRSGGEARCRALSSAAAILAQTSGRRDEWARYIGSDTPSQSLILPSWPPLANRPSGSTTSNRTWLPCVRTTGSPVPSLGQSLIHVTHFRPPTSVL